MNHSIPGVTIIAGFLGAGKTTLINHLLNSAHGRRLGIMVNDFGALNIDEALIDEQREDLITLSNGCVCCSLQGELSSAIESLLSRRGDQLDHLLIECSGVSDPERVVHVLRYPNIRRQARLDGVITVVDASQCHNDLSPALRHLVASQIDNADLVMINKADLVDSATLEAQENHLLHPDTRYLRTTQAKLPADFILWHSEQKKQTTHESRHVSGETSIEALGLYTYHWEHSGPLDTQALNELLITLPPQVLRFKGIVCLEDGKVLALQRAAGRVTSWEIDRSRKEGSRLVFIGTRASEYWKHLEKRLQSIAL